MAYEKLLNEIYAAISLEYLWPLYRPCFVKSESPDWINESMELGLEVSQALLPDDGQAENFLERIPLPENVRSFLAAESERLRHGSGWSAGTSLDSCAIRIVRATKLWQQAGAYYVRIQGMSRQHRIPLEREFDVHDTPETKYIVLFDNNYPIGTCRLFAVSERMAEIGRVVVLEKYWGRGLGKLLIREAEKWIGELGFSTVCVESRDVAAGFYEKLGYRVMGEPKAGETFVCVHMEKELKAGDARQGE